MMSTVLPSSVGIIYIFVYFVAVLIDGSSTVKEETDYEKIEYGGIIKDEDTAVSNSDEHVKTVIKFACDFVQRRQQGHPSSDCAYDVHGLRKKNLLFSYDDSSPVVLVAESVAQDEDDVQQQYVAFGHLYSFSLSYTSEQMLHTYFLTVSEYPMNIYNIYTQTYYSSPVNSSCDHLSTQEGEGKSCDSKFLVPPIGDDVSSDIDQSAHLHDKYGNLYTGLSDGLSCQKQDSVNTNCNCDCLKILTFNTWNMNSVTKKDEDYVKRIELFGKISADIGADVICFQEVRYQHNRGGSLGPSQVQHLIDMLKGYQFVFVPAQLQINSLKDGRTEEGLAVFSKYPIINYSHLKLFRNRSNTADRHQRVCLHVQVLHPMLGITHILTTHLSLSHEAREKSVFQIWKYIQTLKGPVIFAGDLNAEPEERSMRFLRGEFDLDGLTTEGLYDVWPHSNPTSPGLTFSSYKNLHKRIDYIFARKSDHLRLEEATVIDDGNRGIDAASDHLPLTAEFKVQR